MTDVEFSKIALTMKEIYPRENLFPTDHSQETWYQLLKDIPYDVMTTSLLKWATTEKWSPSISEIRQVCYEVQNPEIPTWDEAWEGVLQAVRHYGYSRMIEGMDSLDELSRKTVSRVGWSQICLSENIAIERAAFRDIYKILSDRKKADGQIAPAIRAVIEATRRAQNELLTDKGISYKGDDKKPLKSEFGALSEDTKTKIKQAKERLHGGNGNGGKP